MRSVRRVLVGVAVVAGVLLPVARPAGALPAPPPGGPGPGEMESAPCFDPRLLCHEAVEGEWLWKLARLSVPGAMPMRPALTDLGDVARRVEDLQARNRSVLRGGDALRPGQILVVGERTTDGVIDLTCDQVLPP